MARTGFAKDQLKSLITRIERLEEERASLSADIREVYAEAKGIPEWFGRMRRLPDLCSAPYFDFVNSQQELKEEFCLGMGEYEIEEYGVADTPIWKSVGGATGNYPEIDVLVMGPGEANTLFSNNVVTSDAVSNIEMIGTNETGYDWSGPFVLNPAGTTTTHAEFDISAPGGLFTVDTTGQLKAATAGFTVEVQTIDDAGVATGAWTAALDVNLNQTTRDAIRTTYGVTLAAGRYQARFQRTNAKATDLNTQDRIAMLAMRAYLPNTVTPSDTTRIAIRARSTQNLNGASAQQFYVIATRKLPIYDPDTGVWSAPTATRDIAPVVAYVCRSTNGLRKTDAQVDLDKLFGTLHPIWQGRGDHFDGIFDTGGSAWTNLIAILRVGRAEPLRLGRQITFNRDEPKTAYAGAFSPANILAGSFNIDYLMYDANTADGVWVSFMDSRNWKPNKVWCALPDSVTDPDTAITIDFTLGITNRDHAWREGMFIVACNRWRRRFPSFRTALEGRACFRGSKILVSHWMPGWGASARVVELSAGSGGDVVTLSEPWDGVNSFNTDQKVITLITPDGKPYGPVTFDLIDDGVQTGRMQARLTQTATVASGKYAGLQPRDWGVWDGKGLGFERPRATFGTATQKAQDAIMMSMKPQGRTATLTAVLDDPRVHYADGTIPPVEGDTPTAPAESSTPPARAADNLTITGISPAEVSQAGGVIRSTQVAFTVRGAPDALSFDARWRWNDADDFSPEKHGLGRTIQFDSVGGTLVLQVRAVGKSGFGAWSEITFFAQSVPPAPDPPAPTIAVSTTQAWIADTQDGEWSWTSDADAVSYLCVIQYQLGDSVWHSSGTISTTGTTASVYSGWWVNIGGVHTSPDDIWIGVKPVYSGGAAGAYVFP